MWGRREVWGRRKAHDRDRSFERREVHVGDQHMGGKEEWCEGDRTYVGTQDVGEEE